MNKIYLLLSFSVLTAQIGMAQKSQKSTPDGWHLKDKQESGFHGISLEKAYNFLQEKKLKSKTVIVAVIDSGIDTLHEDLKPVLWVNGKEIPGNKKDDDKNGYVDDVNGWNFIGGKDGRNVKEDSYEAARVYNRLKLKYGSTVPDEAAVKPEDREEVIMYGKAQKKVVGDANPMEEMMMRKMLPGFKAGDSVIVKELGKKEYNCKDLSNFESTNEDAKKVKTLLTQICKGNETDDITNVQIIEELEGQIRKFDAAKNPPREYRKEIVQDNESDINDRFYGNNDIMASTPFHGTHCSGIIGAVRKNGKGIDGIADNVRLMTIRAVPDGDEHDKDIALAIRYAVDNGAQIVSMSFGKGFSPEKHWVDDAVKYAESKGVLLVHAAGNDAMNLDSSDNFPNPVYQKTKQRASNWITVGASGDPGNGGIAANFSNYGKNEVDLFAPGVQIYSTIPGGNTYGNANGTSMACPVVSGTAALLLSYFPKLSAQQLKMILEKTVMVPAGKVTIPGTEEKATLKDLSRNGGIVNAFEAVKLASTLKGERK
jgi:subtilisin family serine protease